MDTVTTTTRPYKRGPYDRAPRPPTGEELRAFRLLWGRTQRQAARICRVAVSTYSRWERGEAQADAASWLLLRITCDPAERQRWLASL
jgi:DNA-binding transcriptional regulator YiaG